MKKTIRTFAIGLLTAGIIMLIGIFFFDSNSKTVDDLAAEEMIPLLKEDGYHVLTNDEYISLAVKSEDNSDETEDKSDEAAKKETAKAEDTVKAETEKAAAAEKEEVKETEDKEETAATEKEQEKEIIKYTLNIEPGMPASSMSSALEDQGIIDDASEFNRYLDDHDYTLKVRMGTHQVNSGMSFYELAEAITK